MECYDISNTQGTEAVGSMECLRRGVPNRSEYRKFKIKTVEGPNDFAMMAEVLTRRFTRAREQQGTDGKFAKLPDLVIVDGGKGQLNAAGHVMDSLGYSYIPLFGPPNRTKSCSQGNRLSQYCFPTAPSRYTSCSA